MPGWDWLVEFTVSCAFGCAAAILPVFNNEAYVVGSQMMGWGTLTALVIGLGVGNGLGKTVVVVLIRQGRRLPWWSLPRRKDDAEPRWPRLGRFLEWWRRQMRRLLQAVSHPVGGLPLVALSAATSVPPFYPVTVVVAASGMRVTWFAVAAAVGSCVRALLLVLAARGIIGLF